MESFLADLGQLNLIKIMKIEKQLEVKVSTTNTLCSINSDEIKFMCHWKKT